MRRPEELELEKGEREERHREAVMVWLEEVLEKKVLEVDEGLACASGRVSPASTLSQGRGAEVDGAEGSGWEVGDFVLLLLFLLFLLLFLLLRLALLLLLHGVVDVVPDEEDGGLLAFLGGAGAG